MSFAKTERAALSDLFDQVGPEAPTLCEGWRTHDLAAHLWIRENDPLGASGLVVKPLAGLTERRMADVVQRWPFAELVDKVRRGPARLSVFAIPGVDEPANTFEFFVHHEDVRRAGDEPLPPRDLDDSTEDWIWRRLKLLSRAFFRRVGVGVTLERAVDLSGDLPGDRVDVSAAEPETIRAQPGRQIVTLAGRPSELLLFAQGRGQAAEIKLVGESEAIDQLRAADLNV